MKNALRFIFALALVAIAGLVFVPRAEAVAAYTRFLNLKVLNKLQLGTDDDKDVIDNSAFGTVDWAFPLDGGCVDTDPVALTGAIKGDPCFVGFGPADGGTAIQTAHGTGQVSCIVTGTGTAILRLCHAAPMGAIIDAGYQIRSFGVQ